MEKRKRNGRIKVEATFSMAEAAAILQVISDARESAERDNELDPNMVWFITGARRLERALG